MDADEEVFGLKVKSSRLVGEDRSDVSDRSHLFFFFTTDSLDVFDLYQEARQTMVKGGGWWLGLFNTTEAQREE